MYFLKRLRARSVSKTLTYALGRFYTVRRTRRAFRSKHRQMGFSATRSVIFSSGNAVEALRQDGLFSSIALESAALARLLGAMKTAQVKSVDSGLPKIQGLEKIHDWNRNNPSTPILAAGFFSTELDAIAREIAGDPQLLNVVEAYLGGAVKKVTWKIEWSLVAEASEQYRERRNQTVMFHFDVGDFDFVYAFFYLTDTDRDCGAHEMIVGSHFWKPLKFLFSTARQGEAPLRAYYGAAHEWRIIEGKKGSGFIEDTSAFHRIRPPVSAPRLALQLRYY